MRHLVTGATGNIGRRVITALRAGGHRPRAFVRDVDKARHLWGEEVELASGDLNDEHALERACADVEALFLVTSGPELAALDARVARVARDRGVRRLVKLSSLGARATGAPTAVARWHAEGEEAIRASGVGYTFVQSVGFMSNALAWASNIRASGAVRASTGDGRIAMIHPDDLAEVAVAALVTDRYQGQAIPVTGPVALTYTEMTDRIGRAIGRALRFEAISDGAAYENLVARGMAAPIATALVALWREVREGLVSDVTGEVARVTGRAPRTFDQWAFENAAAFR